MRSGLTGKRTLPPRTRRYGSGAHHDVRPPTVGSAYWVTPRSFRSSLAGAGPCHSSRVSIDRIRLNAAAVTEVSQMTQPRSRSTSLIDRSTAMDSAHPGQTNAYRLPSSGLIVFGVERDRIKHAPYFQRSENHIPR